MYRLNTVKELLSEPEEVREFLQEKGLGFVQESAPFSSLRVMIFEEPSPDTGKGLEWFCCMESDVEPFAHGIGQGDIVLRKMGESGADILGVFQMFDHGYEMADTIQDLYSVLEVLADGNASPADMIDARDALDHAEGYLSSLRALFCGKVEEAHMAEIRKLMKQVESHTEAEEEEAFTTYAEAEQAEWARPYLEEGVLAYCPAFASVERPILRKVSMKDGHAWMSLVAGGGADGYSLPSELLFNAPWQPAKPLTRVDALAIATHKASVSSVRDATDFYIPIKDVVECADGSGYLIVEGPEGLFYEHVPEHRMTFNHEKNWLMLQAGVDSCAYNAASPTGSFIFKALRDGAAPIQTGEQNGEAAASGDSTADASPSGTL